MAINNYYALFFFRSSKFKSYTAKSKDLQTTILEGQKEKEKWQHKVDTKGAFGLAVSCEKAAVRCLL
jgi:hypothetical protein